MMLVTLLLQPKTSERRSTHQIIPERGIEYEDSRTRHFACSCPDGSCVGWSVIVAAAQQNPIQAEKGFQNPPRKDFRRNNPRIRRITKNILDRMINTK
jgi:hypothetical protein